MTTAPNQIVFRATTAPAPEVTRGNDKAGTTASMFTYAPVSTTPLEANSFEFWWHQFGDPCLEALIQSALQHGYDVSAAQLRLQAHQARFPMGSAPEADEEAPFSAQELVHLYRGWQALAEFYAIRARIAAQVGRRYFSVLMLRERMAAADASIARQRAAMVHARESAVGVREAVAQLQTVLTDQDAHRIRLQHERDAALVMLAQVIGEPLSVTAPRVKSQMLPGAAAEGPHPGTPADLRRRRPDLRAAYHAVQAARAAAGDGRHLGVRQAEHVYEQAAANAVAEVECALLQLSSRRDELTPIRAAALAIDTTLRRRQDREPAHLSGWLQVERMRYARQDEEIVARGRTYLALLDLFEALGGGWPIDAMASAPFDPAQAP
ncbi:MAG TPA: hypothetical protein VGQ93_01120 [Lysobacter sp.]|jgi:outer membrane protein TolC|nr:hypothetical protein [Lysobacter sp.]